MGVLYRSYKFFVLSDISLFDNISGSAWHENMIVIPIPLCWSTPKFHYGFTLGQYHAECGMFVQGKAISGTIVTDETQNMRDSQLIVRQTSVVHLP